MKLAILLAAAIIAPLGAQRPTQPARSAPDRRPPLDPSRSVYVDDQSGVPNGITPVVVTLRTARLWTIRDRQGAADLVLLMARLRASGPSSRAAAQPEYELTIRPARGSSPAPLWRAVAASPDALAKRLKADLAPSVCVALWCR